MFTERTAWARNLAAPVRSFLTTEASGAVALLAAAVAALAWSNSPWSDSYESLWTTHLSIAVGDHDISLTLREWVSDGLMTLFFLVVGLEARREFDTGALRERRRIALPVLGAICGMAAPALIYTAFNAGGSGAHAWGVAMSTDTAFALGVLALVAPRITRLRVRLLPVLVVDDLVALLVIATVYSESVEPIALAVAACIFAALLALRWVPVAWRTPPAVFLGVALWFALHDSGVDPLVSGLAVGLAISAYPPARSELERATELTRSFREQPTPELARSAALGVSSAISANERLQYRLHPWTSFVIAPLFALANAGIQLGPDELHSAGSSSITWAIVVARVVGKTVGITLAVALAVRFGLGRLPGSVTRRQVLGVSALAGIGFTVALFIADVSYGGERLADAKLGILASALAAGVVGCCFLFRSARPTMPGGGS
jgi:Na+/H+ antiporter NhaA